MTKSFNQTWPDPTQLVDEPNCQVGRVFFPISSFRLIGCVGLYVCFIRSDLFRQNYFLYTLLILRLIAHFLINNIGIGIGE